MFERSPKPSAAGKSAAGAPNNRRFERSRLARRLLALCALCAATTGCKDDLTEMVLVVRAEHQVPSELDQIDIEVRGPTGQQTINAPLSDGQITLPAVLSLSPSGKLLEPLEVIVRGQLGGQPVIEQAVETRFYAEERRTLAVFFTKSCNGVCCGADLTCRQGRCGRRSLTRPDLPRWRGLEEENGPVDPDDLDPNAPQPQRCFAGATEQCNRFDDDCDGVVDEGFDLASDPANCGVCGFACRNSGSCTEGVCENSPPRQVCAL